MNKSISRRDFIKAAGAAWVLVNSPSVFAAQSMLSKQTKKPLIWIMLRGGLDPLHTVMPVDDPDFAAIRAPVIKPIAQQLLPLSKGYALHPDLPFFHQLFKQGQLNPVVAVATGYRERSHFEAQDQLESGLDLTDHQSGWMGRALAAYHGDGLALARAVPIAMQTQSKDIQTWYPSAFDAPDDDILQRLANLYADDEQMQKWLELAVMQSEATDGMQQKRRARFVHLAKNCGQLLSEQANISCAMLELNGWDTHNNMQGRLSRQFKELDEGLAALKDSLGQRWHDTLIVINTEFGRTVALNGTSGTDHGTASMMFLAGGAMSQNQSNFAKFGFASQRVLGTWPGLSENQLHEGRDLRPTSDTRYWMSKALQAHWGLDQKQVSQIFPDLEFT